MSTINRRRFIGACAAGAGAALIPGTAASAPGLGALVRRYLDRGMELGFPGFVCGVVAGGETYVGGAGRIAGPGSPEPDGRTLFQIGSITKTLTALQLGLADAWRLVRLDDPLATHAPDGWRIPAKGNRPIRLVDLATHSSGLPALPPNVTAVPGFDPADPYATYTRAHLASGLAATELAGEPGTRYRYSNLAFALLGETLSGLAGTSYGRLMRGVTLPLGMVDTTLRPGATQRHRTATGHGPDGLAVPAWTGEVFAGAGSMTFGTGNDLVRYLRGQLDPDATVFGDTLRTAQREHFADGGHSVGLGWERFPLPNGRTMVWKNGATGGFSSFAAFCPQSRVGVAMLNNLAVPADPATPWPLDSLGVNLLRALDQRR